MHRAEQLRSKQSGEHENQSDVGAGDRCFGLFPSCVNCRADRADFSKIGAKLRNPGSRPRSAPTGSIARVGELTPIERQTAATDAFGEARFEPLEFRDT